MTLKGLDKISPGEMGEVYQAYYSLINRGDGITRCAWCERNIEDIKRKEDLNIHIDEHDKVDKD